MAGHLIAAGHQLFVFTLGKMPEAIAGTRATQCVTARVTDLDVVRRILVQAVVAQDRRAEHDALVLAALEEYSPTKVSLRYPG